MSWLGQLGGMVAIKILFILWAGTLWRAVFRSREFGRGEIYVFTTYAMDTTGVLWSLLPIADLLLPVMLARSEGWVAAVTLAWTTQYRSHRCQRCSGRFDQERAGADVRGCSRSIATQACRAGRLWTSTDLYGWLPGPDPKSIAST